MTRRINCEKCGQHLRPMHAEDVSMGFKRRRVQITVKKPAVHDVTTLIDGKVTNVESLPSIMCDSCGAPIPDGSTAWAETMWRSSREGEPGNWEKEYQ